MTRARGRRNRVLRDGRGSWEWETPDYASEASEDALDEWESAPRDASGRLIRNSANMTAEELSAAQQLR